jgi:hypothetical protein
MDASEFAGISRGNSGWGLGTGHGDEWGSGCDTGRGNDCYGGGYFGDGSGYGTCRSTGYGYGDGSKPW